MMRTVITPVLIMLGVFSTDRGTRAQELVPCAPEWGFCRVPFPTRVIFGIPGWSTSRFVTGRGIPCTIYAFGDPAPGRVKHCAFVASDRRRFWPPR